MTKALIKQAHDIRTQAAQLLVRAENLLRDLQQLKDITAPAQPEENIQENGRRIILELR